MLWQDKRGAMWICKPLVCQYNLVKATELAAVQEAAMGQGIFVCNNAHELEVQQLLNCC